MPKELLNFTGKLKRGDFLEVRRHQVAPIIETAVRRIIEAMPQDFSIANASTVSLGQILLQVEEKDGLRSELLDPYQVFIRYLAYNKKGIESYLLLREEQDRHPYKHRERISQPMPGIDRIIAVSLVDGTASFIDRELDQAIRGTLKHGYSSFKIEGLCLEPDSDFDWGHLYTFECELDEQAAIKRFSIPETNLIIETWR
jgi:hypothetical protein